MPTDSILECAKAAEKAGFEYISFAESFYRDASVLASAVACNTSRIKIGTSVYPISTRSPFQIAMASATINEISHGRLGFIGLGVGYKARIEQYFGLRIEKPVAKMREYIQVLEGLLLGKPFSFQGANFSFQEFPPLVPQPLRVPILLGSSGPRMLRLAGELADGVVLNSIGTQAYFKHALSLISEGERAAGKKARTSKIAASVIVSVADDVDEAVNNARPDVLFYLLYPELNPVIRKTPYSQKVKEIRRAYSTGASKKALSLVTDEMVEELSIAGTPKQCREKLKILTQIGITLPIIRVSVQPFSEDQRRKVFLETIRALAPLTGN
jgi:5,10-methylenetetrahydromethanopterin reductase